MDRGPTTGGWRPSSNSDPVEPKMLLIGSTTWRESPLLYGSPLLNSISKLMPVNAVVSTSLPYISFAKKTFRNLSQKYHRDLHQVHHTDINFDNKDSSHQPQYPAWIKCHPGIFYGDLSGMRATNPSLHRNFLHRARKNLAPSCSL
ncbi:hypothetical protein KCU95_g63, partial [Aureobasidium melanogenum]